MPIKPLDCHVRLRTSFSWKKPYKLLLQVFLIVSLFIVTASHQAIASEESDREASAETSSPEDSIEWSQQNLSSDLSSDTSFSDALLGREPRFRDNSPQNVEPPKVAVGSLPSAISFQPGAPTPQQAPLSPLLTQGVFPYQANPIAAVISAGLTLAVMSLKETGKVDMESILFLLNSTDFYAGLAGSISGARGQQAGKSLLSWLAGGVKKSAPEMLEPLAQKEALKVVKNIVDGFTYTFSVSAGYEVFSQFWKIATKNIPEAHKMTGFLGSPMHVKKRVLLNLLYYTVMDKGLQKRVIDSVYHHRIMTFEFIAMNVGIYVGAQLGNFVAKKYMPGNVWAERLAPAVGSVTGGVLVQLIPDSWKSHFNHQLLSWKISSNRNRLKELEETLSRGINKTSYPSYSVSGVASYWMSGVDLEDDIERMFAKRDMLSSLLMQEAMANGQSIQPWRDMRETYETVQSFLISEIKNLDKAEANAASQIALWITEGKSPVEIQQLSTQDMRANPKRVYYRIILSDAYLRAKEAIEDFNGLEAALKPQN